MVDMVNRRKWLARFVSLAGLSVAAVLAIPAVMTALSPAMQRRRGPLWKSVGLLNEFPINEVMTGLVELPHDHGVGSPRLEKKAVFVWRRSADEVIVYSRNCTDLSCPLAWDPGSNWFYCPCHGGIFTIEGEPVAGPPSEPMYRYESRVREGVLEIDLHSLPPMT